MVFHKVEKIEEDSLKGGACWLLLVVVLKKQ